MHGFSIAQELMKKVKDLKEKNGSGKITRIRIKCGKNVFHDPCELTQAYKLLSPEYGLKDTKLEIEWVEGNDCKLEGIDVEDFNNTSK